MYVSLTMVPILERIIRWLVPYAAAIAGLFLILTYFAFPPAVGLIKSISTELSDLLPEHYPSVKLGNEVKERFHKKGGGDLVLIIDAPDSATGNRAREALVDYLRTFPEIEKVKETKTAFEFFDRHKLLYLEMEDLEEIRDRIDRKIQQEKLGSLYIDLESSDSGTGKEPFAFDDLIQKYQADYVKSLKSKFYTNKDETIFALWIYPLSKDSSLTAYKEFHDLVTSRVAQFPLAEHAQRIRLFYAGSIDTRINEYTSMVRDLKMAGIVSVVGIFVLLLFFFRRPLGVVLIFIPLVSGILFGFALSSFFIPTLNVVTSFLFSILFGLGVDIGIHMLARYMEDREAGVAMEDALVNIILKTGRSSSVAVATTCATFFLLIINDFRGFSEFGIIAGIGLLATLVTYLIFFPSILVVAERLKILKLRKARHRKIEDRISRWSSFPHARKVVLLCAGFLVLAVILLPFVSFEWNYRILKIQIPEAEEARAKLREVNQRVNSPAAIQISDERDATLLKEEFARRKKTDVDQRTIDAFRSSYDLYPLDQAEKMAMLKDIDHLLADDALNVLKEGDRKMVNEFRTAIATTEYVKREDIPTEVIDTFFGIGEFRGEEISFIYPLPDLELDDGRNAIAFYNDVHEVEAGGKKFYAVSNSIIFADVLRTMFEDSRRVILLSLVVLALLIYWDFRDWKKTALVLGILLFGMAGMGALVVLAGWKFNFYNMITIPVVLGMGEDNSVHLIHRYEELKKGSVMKALMSSGSAAMMASLTTMIGFAGLVFAHHPGLRSIGIFAIVGMLTCMVGSLVFLPAVLEWSRLRQRDLPLH